MGDCKRYEPRVTTQQKEILINFMEDHPDFAKGKLLGSQGRKSQYSLWEVLAQQLNSCGGPEKTSAKWQRVWTDLKNKTKKKANAIKKSRTITGGGPPSADKLSGTEQKIISLLTDEAVHGLQGQDGVPLDSEESIQYDVHEDHTAQFPTEHDYTETYNITTPSPLSDSIPTPSSAEVTLSAPVDVTVTPTTQSRRRKRFKTTAAEATEKFTIIGETLNNKMDGVLEKLDELVTERRKTNALLQTLIDRLTDN